jgi:hypothetical protein
MSNRNREIAYHRARNFRKHPCPECGLRLCICQTSLEDYTDESHNKVQR